MYYITSRDQLIAELSSRASKRAEIRASVSSFIQNQYGIEDLFGILDRFFSGIGSGEPHAILARQVASISTEDLSFTVGAKALGLSPLTIPFGRDSYTSRNHDKLHRVKIPWTSWSKKGNLIIEYERATRMTNAEIEGSPLDRIEVPFCGNLVSYHANLRELVTGERPNFDVSSLYVDFLRASSKKPEFVFREHNGREMRTRPDHGLILDRDRPPASWYYVLYLSWFIDGSLILFETYDNPLSEVIHAKSLFEDTVRKIVDGTGIAPLIVKIPHLSMDMLYCNRHILRDGKTALLKLSKTAQSLDTTDTVSFFRHLADQVIGYR